MMSFAAFVSVIGTFGFRACFGFRTSDFEFPGQAKTQMDENLVSNNLPGLSAYPKYEAFSPTKGLERFSSPMVVVGP